LRIQPRNILYWALVFVPIALIVRYASPGSHTLIFALAAIAIIPLAGIMGRATEHLADKTGEGIGGLLNATFGNMAEIMIAVLALREGLYSVVKASLRPNTRPRSSWHWKTAWISASASLSEAAHR
jgi:Ca2+:H+ antiporter